MGALLLVMAILYYGLIVLGEYIFAANSIPDWYLFISVLIAAGLPAYIGMRLDSPRPSHTPDGYPGWWNR